MHLPSLLDTPHPGPTVAIPTAHAKDAPLPPLRHHILREHLALLWLTLSLSQVNFALKPWGLCGSQGQTPPHPRVRGEAHTEHRSRRQPRSLPGTESECGTVCTAAVVP